MEPKKAKPFLLKKEIFEWMETLAWALVAVVLTFTFIARTATVDGDSMLPTLENGDRLIISHLGENYQYGDIIVFPPELRTGTKSYIKRVIATQLQTVDIDFDAGIVYVDGVALDEPYVNDLTHVTEGVEFPVVVPHGCLFVMGDNRNASKDSRDPSVGMVPVQAVEGKVWVRFMPFDKIGMVK